MKKQITRLMSVLLCLAMLTMCLASCVSSPKVVMSIGKQELTLNMYELLLSRMKGTLEYNGYPTDEDTFWQQIISTKGQTYDAYFCESVRDEAKKMLVQLYLYEEVYGLTLPQKQLTAVDEFINDVLTLNFDGSKSDFNGYLSNFGVNMTMLRENYIMEEKIDHLGTYISSITSDAAREQYYTENYACFRQILLPLYEYCYVTDDNGDTVYYRENSDKIYYDTTANTRTDDGGNTIKDENGDVVYFTDDGRIAYNTEKGIKRGLDEDNDGYVDYKELDADMKTVITDRANSLSTLIANGDFIAFEEYGEQWSSDDVWNTYPDGIYVNLNKAYQINYMDDIQAKLADMKVGDTALIRSENAYHFIMKYELAAQGYADKSNADWFDTFEDEVIGSILDAMCEEYLDKVTVNGDALAQARGMKEIGANTEY